MTEPVWVSVELAIALHGEQLKLFGGADGLRDRGGLESALDRPKNKWSYEQADLATLAAAYGFAIARNHAFVDGNKRAAFLCVITFLGLNGVDFLVDEAEAVVMMRDLASGEIDEDGLTRWIRDNWPEGAGR